MTSSHQDEATSSSQADGEKPAIEDIQADIEQTRQELAETVEALTAKLDVKSRAQERLNDVKRRAKEQLTDARTRAGTQVTTVRTQANGHITTVRTRATGLTASARTAATTPEGKPKPAVLGGAAAVVVSALAGTGLLLWRRRR